MYGCYTYQLRLAGDAGELLAFYDYPADHWVHLRTRT